MTKTFISLLLLLLLQSTAQATIYKSHGYAQFGQLKYPASFTHFDWVNPDAPKQGTLRIMANGTFDTLNPYSIKGTSPSSTSNFLQYGVNELNETLMAGTGIYDPSGDEPASNYGLIAQSVEYSDDRSWVVFNLRKDAKFNDGYPITAEDVAFSYHILLKEGHPQYRTNLQEVKRVDILNSHKIRFVFKHSGNPLFILRMGELPVLPKHYWKNHDFKATTYQAPIGSGPYKITKVKPGRSITFEHVKNWWGENLPVNKGKYNFNKVKVEFYRDHNIAFEAFKAGEFDFYIEQQAKNWAKGYNFQAVRSGQIIKREIVHHIPTRTQGLFMNTRRPLFSDNHVREALGLMFNFEWSNRVLFNSAYTRTDSYFPNSKFSARGIPKGAEWLLLSPYRDQLPKKMFTTPFVLPKTEGRNTPRPTLHKALNLLKEAGWNTTESGLLEKNGKPFKFEILLVNPRLERILLPFIKSLERLGIHANLHTVDSAQYKRRLDQFNFDMILLTLPQTLSPGFEQLSYFQSKQADIKGSRNYAGIKNPVVDHLLDSLLSAKTQDQQIAAARALDRVLLWEHYMIPNWYIGYHRIAYRNKFSFVKVPPYTLGLRAWWKKTKDTKN